MQFYNKNIEDIFDELNTSESGLSSKEADIRILKYGKNELEEKKKKSWLFKFLEQFNDLMIIILLIVAVFLTFYGLFFSHEYTDAIVIFAVVLINSIMSFIQEEKAEVTLNDLKKYSVSKCKVKRDGVIHIIDSSLIVPGDIVIYEAGDKVTSDARIINESNLSVDESALTGESLPVSKNTQTLDGKKIIQDRTNMLFCGSVITNGKATAVVVSTGMLSEIGLIAVSLNTPYTVQSPLETKIKELSKKITILIFIIILFIFIYGLINGYKILEILMLCVSLSVAAIPEGLPAVITITLSNGAAALFRKNTVVKQIGAVETLGAVDVICSDKTGTITENKMKVLKTNLVDENMFELISVLCNDAVIGDEEIGDPTEISLLNYIGKTKIKEINDEYQRLIDAPFDSSRKMMSTFVSNDKKSYVLVKGSLENLLKNCNLSDKEKEEILKKEKEMSDESLRVIGFAYKEVKKEISTSKELLDNENNLTYVGICGMIDPPRKTVASSVLKCKKAGIRPIMITGDSLNTAVSIAKSVGIIETSNEGILGSELDNYSDEELKDVITKYSVYARVTPEHKRRIVTVLQSMGKVVSMTGDGVNDAPAIKDAHVGIGMGITGTEVTKNVADVILLDDSFSTIVDAVEEGRRIYANIRNNIVYSLSSNFAEIFVVLISMIFGYNILLPIHILFIDLITDSIPSICLSYEKAEKDIMNQKPRGLNKPMFTKFLWGEIIISAIIETTFVLVTYFIGLKYFSNDVASTLALLSLVMQEIIYAFSCRNLKKYAFKEGIFSNKAFNIGISILLIIEALVFLTPIGNIINIVVVDIKTILLVVLFNLFAFIIYEISKVRVAKIFKD
mgnify:FL=1